MLTALPVGRYRCPVSIGGAVDWMERHQVPLYLGSLGLGALLGASPPADLEAAITPVLIALLYATFLGVPLARLRHAFSDARFMAAILAVNFLAAPVVVAGLTRMIADHPALLVGALLVLLAPCVDYVMVFTRLAGGAWEKTLAASPVLMLAQMLLLPAWIALLGPSAPIDWRPLAQGLVMIALPLGLASLTHWAARGAMAPIAQRVERGATALMVPLMMATLIVVVASQIATVSSHLGQLARVVPVFALFGLVMPVVGRVLGRMAGQDARSRLALAFSGTTRNSLVVLPLALALPAELGLAPIVVVTQTLVELVLMVIYVRLLPAVEAGLGRRGGGRA